MKESTSFCWVSKAKINCFYACLALGILVNANRVRTFCFLRQKAQILSKFAGAITHCWGVPQLTRVPIPPQQGEKKRLPFSVRQVWPWSWSRSETSFNTSIYLSPPSRFGSNWKWMQLRLNGVFAKRRLATVFAESTDCKIARFDFYDFVMSPNKTTWGKI